MLFYLKFHFKLQLPGEEDQYITSPFIFFLKKNKFKKNNNNISYLIMALVIFLGLSRYGIACKYEIIFQIPIYSWMQNYIF